jgi:hypothetical protein
MRLLLPAIAPLILASSLAAAGADARIERVWPGFRTADSFARIRDYFRSDAMDAGTYRTQPVERAGYYFLVRVENDGLETEATIVASVIPPGSTAAIDHLFPVRLSEGGQAFNLGLTGTHWLSPDTHPLAWQIRVLAPGGTVIAESHSFLWSRPPEQGGSD